MDGTTSRNNSGLAADSHWNVWKKNTGVDGPVINALFSLLNESLPESFPVQVLGDTVNLLESLVDGHSANRNRRVAENPLAGLMDLYRC